MCLNCGDCRQPHPLITDEVDLTGDIAPNLLKEQHGR